MRGFVLGLLLTARAVTAATFLSEIQTIDDGTQVGRAISPDGQFLYTAENIYARSGGGILAPLGLYGTSSPNDLALGSDDAAFVYVSGTNRIGVHARDPMTGLLTFVELEPRPPVPLPRPGLPRDHAGRDQPVTFWEATYSLPKRNDINSITAKSD